MKDQDDLIKKFNEVEWNKSKGLYVTAWYKLNATDNCRRFGFYFRLLPSRTNDLRQSVFAKYSQFDSNPIFIDKDPVEEGLPYRCMKLIHDYLKFEEEIQGDERPIVVDHDQFEFTDFDYRI